MDIKKFLKDKRNWLLISWPLAFGLYFLAKNFESFAENVCTRGIFRVYGWIMSHISGIIPFSLAEILLIAVMIFIPLMIILSIVRIIRRPEKGLRALRSIRDIIMLLGVVFCWYMIGCGTNYYRNEFADFSGLTIEKSTKEELYELCLELGEKTNEARARLEIPEGETFKSGLSNSERAAAAAEAMDRLAESYEVLEGYYPKPKSVLFSRVMSEFNITGVYFPWTVEANVNVDVPDYSRGSTLCHELVHLRGFMREDEANYVGYLACVNSENDELRYSGYMSALINASNRLYDEDKELHALYWAQTYNEGVRLDMVEANEYWDQFKDTVLSEAGEKINNSYLKANSISDGTKSYGRMVDLLLAEYRKKHQVS